MRKIGSGKTEGGDTKGGGGEMTHRGREGWQGGFIKKNREREQPVGVEGADEH